METDYKKQSLHFLDLSHKYLQLSANLIGEMIKNENACVLVSNYTKEVNIHKEHDKKTEYSDFNIMVPLLFNLYHGLELYIKGLMLLLGKKPELKHSIDELLLDFENDPYELSKILAKYIELPTKISFIKAYCEINSINTSHEFYMNLRYPSDRLFENPIEYYQLKYHGEDIIDELKEINKDIEHLIKMSIKNHRDKYKSST
jgi:HEPN domain-containing protein